MCVSDFKFDHEDRANSRTEQMQGEDRTKVSDTQYMMEALYGTSAALAAVAIACDRLVDGMNDDAVFWMKVYRAIVAANPEAQLGGKIFH